MKLSYALQAACIALSLSSASATATTNIAVNDATEKAKPGTTVDIEISFANNAAHTAANDYFEITLPDSFDATLAATPVAAEVTLNCMVTGGGAEDLTLGTHYDASYANRKLKFTHKATKLCGTGAVKVTFLKGTMRASKMDKDTVLVTNSKVDAEKTTPVKGPAADVIWVGAALGGTPPTASDIKFDATAKTFEIKYKPAADLTTTKVTLVLYDYVAGGTSKCKIGTTDVTTMAKGTEGKYTWIEIDLNGNAADKLLAASSNTITCTEITPNTGRAVYKGGVQLWDADTKAVFLSTPAVVVPTPAPASNKTNGTTTGTGVSACVATYGTESAAAGTDVTKLCAAIKKYGTCIESHKSDALYTATKAAIDTLNKKCAEHSSSSKAVASTFVIAAAAFAAAY